MIVGLRRVAGLRTKLVFARGVRASWPDFSKKQAGARSMPSFPLT